MARVIRGYDPYTVNSELFGGFDDDRRQMNRMANRHGSGGSWFADKVVSTFNRIKESKAYRRSLAATRKVRNIRDRNTIMALDTVDKMQHAPRRMQDYIMAGSEFVSSRYNRGAVHGWENGFAKDNKKSNPTLSNKAYRELNDGIVRKGEKGYVIEQMLDRSNLKGITLDQYVDIKYSIDKLEERVLAGGEDWCSEYCEII